MNEKQKLTKYRRAFALERGAWMLNPQMRELENRYGHILFIPFDIEPIKPDNPTRFKEWYFDHAKKVNKIYADVAGPAGGSNYSGETFLSINTPGLRGSIWQQNTRRDIYREFPEIKEKLTQLPFDAIPEFMMWSSQRTVALHRDQGPWIDFPASFRVSLFDENPDQTLYIREELPDGAGVSKRYMLPNDLNAFAWNNVRVKHASLFNPDYRKVLLITSQQNFDLKKFDALMERSLAKYGDRAIKSTFTRSDFLD